MVSIYSASIKIVIFSPVQLGKQANFFFFSQPCAGSRKSCVGAHEAIENDASCARELWLGAEVLQAAPHVRILAFSFVGLYGL